MSRFLHRFVRTTSMLRAYLFLNTHVEEREMLENPARSYDPGYAAGATLRRASSHHSETACEQGLILRLESWAAHQLAAAHDAGAWRAACREHFRRGFRDGYWGRARRRCADAALERVA